MEFPGEIVSNIIEQRIGLPSNPLLNDNETHDRIIQQISHVLSYGLSMDIFILLTNENCHSSLECNSIYPIECWKIQKLQQNEAKNIASPPLLPLFLKNAIRSQLHFSPINSWLSQNNNKFPEGFKCSYRISAKNSSTLKLPETEIETHSFPLCKFATLSPEMGEFLSVSVEWIRFTDFPQLDFCSCKLLDASNAWVLPSDSPPTSAEDSEGTISSFPPSPNGCNFTATKTISKETDVELLSNFLSNSAIDSEKHKKLRKKRTNSKSEDLGETTQKDVSHQRIRRSTVVAEEKPASSPTRTRTCKSFSGFSTAFNPKTRLPLNSSPAPSKRTPMSLASKLRAKFSLNNGDSSSSDSEYVETKDSKLYGTSQSSNALLCNFEESALNGRIEPISNIEGFKLQLAVSGSFSINHTMLPLNTYFFDVSGDEKPSLFLGHCTFKDSPFGKKTVRIPKKCVVQATIFNPQGSVVRIFIVRIDVSDMPPRCKTFIRQRTCATALNEDRISLSSVTSVSSSSSNLKLSILRYLINLRLISDRCGRVYLHTDIRCLFSNNHTDIDVMNLMASEQSTKKRGTLSSDTSDNVSTSPITYELITLTEMPEKPKYSPIK